MTLENRFIEDNAEGVGHWNVVSGGMQPKKLTKFWTKLQKEEFNVPQKYILEQYFRGEMGSETNDDLPF